MDLRGTKTNRLICLVSSLLALSACSKGSFSFSAVSQLANPLGTTGTIQAVKPALAVRALSCLMCHAQIHSNVITDFGSGDPQFFVGQDPAIATPGWGVAGESMDLLWYGNYTGAWQSATISGN